MRSAVFCILRDGPRVLLAQRMNTGHQDGNFGLPAGHIDEGETAREALLREVSEEVGVQADPAHTRLVHMQHYTRGHAGARTTYIDWHFECTRWSGAPSIGEPDKCGELRWCTLDALPDNTIDYIRDVLVRVYERGENYSEWGFDNIDRA
jgi:8-oxo-dGTP diphosphatase